jgi:hypothetical protein
MRLKSALEDLKQTTLAAVSGLLAKLDYLASLRQDHGSHEHWGLQAVHGAESSKRALKTAHAETLASVLRTPLAVLVEDVEISRGEITAGIYITGMQNRFESLVPGDRKEVPMTTHLSSVLAALSSLQQNRGSATRSVS